MNYAADLRDAGFFVLRTPALPAEDFLNWTKGLNASHIADVPKSSEQLETAWNDDVRVLRDRLRRLVDRPEISQALFVASPALRSGIAHWKLDPSSKKGLQAERALVRYFSRMCTRCTPFGLFSGCSFGRTTRSRAERPALELQSRRFYRTNTRLDYDFLFALTDALGRDKELSKEFVYSANTSLHKFGDYWHYVESRVVGDGSLRSHHLVKVESDSYMDAAIARADPQGANFSELVSSVLANEDFAVSPEDAEGYVRELIENGVLISTLSPLVTGEPPLDDIIRQLERLPSGAHVASELCSVRAELAALDIRGIGASTDEYHKITSRLEKLPAEFNHDHPYQVDMIKPSEDVVLTAPILDSLMQAVEILCRFHVSKEPEPLTVFRKAFIERYERALVPLLDALDEESGIGFGPPGAYESTAILGLPMQSPTSPSEVEHLTPTHEFLLDRIMTCFREGSNEVRLKMSDIPAFPSEPTRLPDSFCMNVELVAASLTAFQVGDMQILVNVSHGPDGARSFARFCHAEPQLSAAVREYLRDVPLDSDEILAEVVHLPEGRIGNVLCRPVLREHEIVFLGRSGAAPYCQIPASDLLVTVDERDEICLFSLKLGRRVIPRLTTAHGFFAHVMAPAYRFLGYLQHQRGVMAPHFSWGPLASLSFLPRLTVDHVVLAVARWRLRQNEIKQLSDHDGPRRFTAVQELRRTRSLPRFVELEESDRTLFVDLDNALSVDAFVHVLGRHNEGVIREVFPSSEQLCVTSDEGRFWHELEIPLVRRRAPDAAQIPAPNYRMPAVHSRNRAVRAFPPGSEWLYVKLFGGRENLDRILTSHLRPILKSTVGDSSIVRWFFVRYADPEYHLRVRFHGNPDRLQRDLAPFITASLKPLVDSGVIWKFQFDTYVREVERYGGSEGVLVSEEIFRADSDAVLELLSTIDSADDLDIRWRIALLGVDSLLTDCGLNPSEKLAVAKQLCDSFCSRFQFGSATRRILGDRFRSERSALEAIRWNHPERGTLWDAAAQIFRHRSAFVEDAVKQLQRLHSSGELLTSISTLASSYVHMHVNRMMRADANRHELVLYDFLFRLYDSDAARSSARTDTVGISQDASLRQ